jgi:hypothetical protein
MTNDKNHVGGRPVQINDEFTVKRDLRVRVVLEIRYGRGEDFLMQSIYSGEKKGPKTWVSLRTLRKDYVRVEASTGLARVTDQRAEREANLENPPIGYDESTHG